MNKQTVLAAVNALPEEIDLEELIERLIFIAKVEEGLRQSENGETVSQEEVKRLARTWGK
ncbi:MAG: hypothetical protein H7Z21_01075 [Hymenobacter sp.]|nr:hypothetical protein [Hymenobacter sp.]